MKKSFHIAVLSLAALGALTLSPQAQAAAFQNGSFETNSGNTAAGWILGGTQTPFVINSEGSTQGTFAIGFNLGGTAGGGILSQTFDTVALQLYTVTFNYGANGAIANSDLQVEVRNGSSPTAGNETINSGSGTLNNGTNVGESFLLNSNILQVRDSFGNATVVGPAPNAEFSVVSFTFTAQSSSSTIAFTDLSNGGGDSQDGILDNITIVPEPSAWFSMVGGLGILVGSRRYTRKRSA